MSPQWASPIFYGKKCSNSTVEFGPKGKWAQILGTIQASPSRALTLVILAKQIRTWNGQFCPLATWLVHEWGAQNWCPLAFWPNSSKKLQKSKRCRCQQRTVCPQHLGVAALGGRASSVRFPVSLKFHRAIDTVQFERFSRQINLEGLLISLWSTFDIVNSRIIW